VGSRRLKRIILGSREESVVANLSIAKSSHSSAVTRGVQKLTEVVKIGGHTDNKRYLHRLARGNSKSRQMTKSGKDIQS
jgi:hypothetical protein